MIRPGGPRPGRAPRRRRHPSRGFRGGRGHRCRRPPAFPFRVALGPYKPGRWGEQNISAIDQFGQSGPSARRSSAFGWAPETPSCWPGPPPCARPGPGRFQARMAGPGISGPMGSVESTSARRPLRCLAVSSSVTVPGTPVRLPAMAMGLPATAMGYLEPPLACEGAHDACPRTDCRCPKPQMAGPPCAPGISPTASPRARSPPRHDLAILRDQLGPLRGRRRRAEELPKRRPGAT